jgi:carboxymethylenebutenolidase
MCDNDSFDDMVVYSLRQEVLSRRSFGSLTLGAGLSSLVPLGCAPAEPATSPAPAAPGSAAAPAAPGSAAASTGTPASSPRATTESEVTITTPDGSCDAYFVHPKAGAFPAVLVWPDILGLRLAFRRMGKRLAREGYAVLVVNPFYRKQKAPTAPLHPDLTDPATRAVLMALADTLSAETAATDAKTFTAWLDQQPSVDKARKIGTTGYCMGGPLVMRTAAASPERVGAVASFHGGGLVTDKPDSPHLLIAKMKARFLIAIAANDDARQPEVKHKLKEAFAQASLRASVEVFERTRHGWCPPDSPVYDATAAEEAWSELLALFKAALG